MLRNRKINYFSIEFIYLLFIVLLASRSCTFTSNLDPRYNTFGFLLYVLPPFFLLNKYKLTIWSKRLWFVIGIFIIYFFLHFYFDETVKYLQYFNIFCAIFISYIIINVYKYDIVSLTEKIIAGLTLFSIIMWLIMHIVGVSAIEQIGMFTPSSTTSSSSILLFNTPAKFYEGLGLFGLNRNCGFSWEPGAFASIVVFGIVLNLLNYNTLNNNNFIILTIGLFTTFSTTGYIAFAILLLFRYIYYSHSTKRVIIGIVIILPLVYISLDLPFMQEKVLSQFEIEEWITSDDETIIEFNENFEKKSDAKQITVNRFEGLKLDYLNFSESPIIGYGNSENSFAKNNISEYIVTSNGIMKEFAQFGIILALLHQICFIRSSRKLNEHFNAGLPTALYIVYFIISFSYSFGLTALFNAFFFFSIFLISKEKNDENRTFILNNNSLL